MWCQKQDTWRLVLSACIRACECINEIEFKKYEMALHSIRWALQENGKLSNFFRSFYDKRDVFTFCDIQNLTLEFSSKLFINMLFLICLVSFWIFTKQLLFFITSSDPIKFLVFMYLIDVYVSYIFPSHRTHTNTMKRNIVLV